jgi:alkanesulfonate monooxygenase SsuD/methylene tetrahydromethanopterin reductase-like flavin-dependent oxidoreductase (luciferase family)
MRLGLHYWNFSTPADPSETAPTLAETARIAEQAGISAFTVMDHYFQMEFTTSAEEPMLEAYTTLGYLAAKTERMTLGVLVTGVMYRYPGLLAKIVTTLDVLSSGRARLGIGASWSTASSAAWAYHSSRSASASNGSKKRCRSASRCGATTTAGSTASTTNWPRHFPCRRRSVNRTRRS